VSSFDFGPAANVVYRAVLNTYPTNSTIIEANILNGNYNLDAASNLAAIGLPAVDYMLFAQPAQQTVVLFSTDAQSVERAKYLADVVNQMEQLTQTVKNDWETGYVDAFEQNTGTGNGSAPSLLINTMVQDYERYIRDGKVGIPAGVRSLGETFPEKTEGYYTQISNELLIASLEAYLNTYKGGNGLGLDDYLIAENASNTANSIISQLQSSAQKAVMLPNTMAMAVDANAAEVDEIYQSLQQTIATLKVDMPSALSILITYQDSDGD
jgi:predicted lipoprotein